MSLATWQETLVAAQADGTALTGITATSIVPATGKLTLPANFWYVGRVVKVTAAGRISTLVTSPGTFTLDVRLGAVIAANGGAMALNIVAKTNVPWKLEWWLTCRAIGTGTSANLMHQGLWTSEAVIGAPLPSAGGAGCHMLPNAAPAVGTGFDSSAAAAIELFGTWSVNNAANTITCHQYKVEAMN